MKPTQKRLKELLSYDPETGVFVRKKDTANVAGTLDGGSGYVRIMVDGKLYLASRLAWLYVEGYFPENQIDHVNRIRHDDRWVNLRHVSCQCNSRNRSIQKNNISGITGVLWHKERRKWQAFIKLSGKQFYLGLFLRKLEAAKARWDAEVKYGFPDCNTTSTAYLYIRNCEGLV